MRPSSNRECVVLLIGIAWAFVPSRARGDVDSDTLIRHGLELRREHDDADALVLFQRAFVIRPTPRARAQIGLAEQSLGRWLAAESDLQAALQADDEWIARNRGPLEEARQFVSTHLGWLTVSSNVPASLVLDGVRAGTVPMDRPLRVVAGNLLLRLEAEGYAPLERPVSVEVTQPARVAIALTPLPAISRSPANLATKGATSPQSSPPSRPATHSQSPHIPWAPLSTAALGLAGVAVGGIFGVETLNDKAARDQHCIAGRCDKTGLDFDSQARREATVSTIAFGVGASALLGSVWLYLRAAASPHSVDVVPLATSSSACVVALGVW